MNANDGNCPRGPHRKCTQNAPVQLSHVQFLEFDGSGTVAPDTVSRLLAWPHLDLELLTNGEFQPKVGNRSAYFSSQSFLCLTLLVLELWFE
jgi:hypothetical protein